MSDLRLRAAERLFHVLGGPAADAALLRERLRLGVLPWERVALAAWAGHATCQALLAEHGQAAMTALACGRLADDRAERRRWARLARKLDKRTLVGAAAAGLQAALDVGVGRNERRACAHALDLLRSWCSEGDDMPRARLVTALDRLRQAHLSARRPSWWALVALLEGATNERPVFVARAADAIARAIVIAGTHADRVAQAVGETLARGALGLDR